MKHTDKIEKTASAPETRTADLKGHINYDDKLGCWCIGNTPIDPQQRTIPVSDSAESTTQRAKKPTAPTHVDMVHLRQDRDLALQRVKDVEEINRRAFEHRDEARKQAAQLAECLRDVTTAAEIVDGSETPDKSDIEHMLACFHKSHEALAAYEAAR